MRRRSAFVLAFIAGGTLAACAAGAAIGGSAELPLRHVHDAALPGHTTRFDYQAVDQAARRLYIAHLGDSTLDVIDLDTDRVIATVPNLADVHGLAVAPDRRRVYATATGTNQLVTIDTATNQVVGRVATGNFPDGVTYDPDDALVVVSNKSDGSLTVVDANTNAVVTTAKLGDETGNVTYDSTTRTIYAAARTPDALLAIKPSTRQLVGRIPLPGCDGAHGVYIDPVAQHAFVACEHNARLVTVDLRTSTATGRGSVGSDPDVLAFDPELHRLYVASESGIVTVFDTAGATARKIAQGHFADHAHTVAVDQASHRVYFPLEDVHGRPILRVTVPNSDR